jgi:predicted dienelactone hydrolase
MNNLIDLARHLPVRDAVQTVSISPVVLSAPERGMPLEMRITLPMTGGALPILLLSHGAGPSLYLSSKDGYGPLANFYAEQGFAVIQPTHGNSKVAGLPHDAPGAPLFWRSRVEDMKSILDRLEEIERTLPALAGRLDYDRIAVVGHSMGRRPGCYSARA